MMRIWVTRQERGAVAGLEGLIFSVLVLLGGLTLIVNAWSVIDAKMAIDSASRDYLRAYTNQSDRSIARSSGALAARRSLDQRNFNTDTLDIDLAEPNGYGPCSTVTVTISAQVPALRAPFVDDFTPVRVSSTLTELNSAHRQMTADDRYAADRTECFAN